MKRKFGSCKGENALFSFYTVNTTLNIWGFTLIMTNSDTSWVSNSSQLSHYLPRVSIRFFRWRVQLSQNCLHFSCKVQVPACHKGLWLSSYKSGFSQLPPRTWLFVITAPQAQWNTDLQLPVYFLIRDLIEDTDEQPDEVIHTHLRRVLSLGPSVPLVLEHTTLMVHRCWPTQKVLKPYYFRDRFMKTSSHRHDPLLT